MRVTAAQLDAKRKGKPLPRPEGEIVHAILDYLALRRDVVAWRNNVGAVKEGSRFIRFGVKGLPDIIGWRRVRPGVRTLGVEVPLDGPPIAQFLAIEVKAPDGRFRPDQQRFLERAREDGVLAFVARSVEDVVRELDGR